VTKDAGSGAAGKFITFEGGEGTGKSTQARRLPARLEALGLTCRLTREPGGTPLAERYRALLLSGAVAEKGPDAEALLMAAARDDHLNTVIRPALRAGEWVICDRFHDSNWVYQGKLGGGDAVLIDEMNAVILDGTEPDMTILLDMPAKHSVARLKARAEDGNVQARFDDLDIKDHERLRDAFRARAETHAARFVVVEASGSEAEVETAVWDALTARFALEGASA